jgi:hypothetical protein
LECCHGGKPNRWAKVQAFLYTKLHVTASDFHIIRVNNTLDTEESDEHEHCLHLQFQCAHSQGCNSSVGIALGYGLDDQGSRV